MESLSTFSLSVKGDPKEHSWRIRNENSGAQSHLLPAAHWLFLRSRCEMWPRTMGPLDSSRSTGKTIVFLLEPRGEKNLRRSVSFWNPEAKINANNTHLQRLLILFGWWPSKTSKIDEKPRGWSGVDPLFASKSHSIWSLPSGKLTVCYWKWP